MVSVRKLLFKAVFKVAKLMGPNTSISSVSFVAISPNGFAGVTPTFVRAATRDNAKETT